MFVVSCSSVMGQGFREYSKQWHYHQSDSLPYRLLLPEDFDETKKYPLILFLHGAGERGSDNESQLTHGGEYFLRDSIRSNYPAIVVFPQCPKNAYWVDINIREQLFGKGKTDFKNTLKEPGREQKLLMSLLEEIKNAYAIDEKRRYLIGLSMGGFGTLELLARKPDYFAAATSICGGGNLEAAERYAKKTAVRLSHGAKDEVVDVNYSRELYQKLLDLQADVKYTEFPETNHNAWDPTFIEPDFMQWMFSKKK